MIKKPWFWLGIAFLIALASAIYIQNKAWGGP
jgi:hypothetical protein